MASSPLENLNACLDDLGYGGSRELASDISVHCPVYVFAALLQSCIAMTLLDRTKPSVCCLFKACQLKYVARARPDALQVVIAISAALQARHAHDRAGPCCHCEAN